jgi:hypothetical protein
VSDELEAKIYEYIHDGKWIIGDLKRGEGDLNPRVLADNGLAIHRLTWLGHLRSGG